MRKRNNDYWEIIKAVMLITFLGALLPLGTLRHWVQSRKKIHKNDPMKRFLYQELLRDFGNWLLVLLFNCFLWFLFIILPLILLLR